MRLIKKLQKVNDQWFYSDPPPLLRLLQIYVKGDMLVVLPLLILIGFVGLWSVKFMTLMYVIFLTLRGFGEMIYWFSHQFWKKEYRPYDFGFKKLGNDAIYILYQLISFSWVVFGVGAIVYIVKFWL